MNNALLILKNKAYMIQLDDLHKDRTIRLGATKQNNPADTINFWTIAISYQKIIYIYYDFTAFKQQKTTAFFIVSYDFELIKSKQQYKLVDLTDEDIKLLMKLFSLKVVENVYLEEETYKLLFSF